MDTPQRHNPYLREIEAVLPRVLALYNTDGLNPMRGVGDRFHAAWKLIDFANGTFQGGAHGLARLKAAHLLPTEISPAAIDRRIEDIIAATGRVMRPNGSLEEAFPYESSFCVTALGAFDALAAMDLAMPGEGEKRQRFLAIIEKMIGFLLREDETHGTISNHLATAAAALVRWHKATGQPDARDRAEELLTRVFRHQSQEGWFSEYGGADPGYQTLATYYLADILANLDNGKTRDALQERLSRSADYLRYFVHLDGSMGGLYGSRNTRFFYPGGMEYLARQCRHAAAIVQTMRESIAARRTVTLSAMDDPNLLPMFNAYCWAAALWQEKQSKGNDHVLPAQSTEPFRKHFPEAGIVADRGTAHYTILSTHKGGVVCHFRSDGESVEIDAGAIGRDSRGRTYTNQTYDAGNEARFDGDVVVVESKMRRLVHSAPGPWSFIALRLLCVTLFRWRPLAELAKQVLVRYLITAKPKALCRNRRTIRLGHDLTVSDEFDPPDLLQAVRSEGAFSAIHMASQGYWQIQDDRVAVSEPRRADDEAAE